MALTDRQARVLGYGGFALLVVLTPVASVYALEYQVVTTSVPLGGDGAVVDSQEVHAYESLSPETRTALDRALDGDGRWYRTAADAPMGAFPFVFEHEGHLYAVTLASGYHWGSWRGKIPPLTAVAGLAGVVVAVRDRIRQQGTAPAG